MKRALLVIDPQNEYFTGKLPISYPAGSFSNLIRVMDAAHTNNIPIIVIQHTSSQQDATTFRKGSVEWELHPEISQKPYNELIEKSLPGSFTRTNLELILRNAELDTVVICGYMSQMCCDTTARQAFHLGFAVEFLSDATGTLAIANNAGSISAQDLQRSVLVTQAMMFSKVLTSEQWIQSIGKD